MSYTVTPTSLAKDAEFSVPVDITGPWNNLKFRPDLGNLVDLLLGGKLKTDKASLKAKEDDLKAKLKEKLRKELNLAPEEEAKPVEEVNAEEVTPPVVEDTNANAPVEDENAQAVPVENTDVQDTETEEVDPEEAAKQQLEDKLKDELGNALKGLFK